MGGAAPRRGDAGGVTAFARPALATVLSPRPWEGQLAAAALESALVRLVARCYNPLDVPASADVVVVGTEVPWLSIDLISRWRAQGRSVIGIFPVGDRPALRMLCQANVTQLFAECADPMVILRAIRQLVAGPEAAVTR